MEGDLNGIDILASCYITTVMWMSQKVVCWWAGFSTVPVVFLVYVCNAAGLHALGAGQLKKIKDDLTKHNEFKISAANNPNMILMRLKSQSSKHAVYL